MNNSEHEDARLEASKKNLLQPMGLLAGDFRERIRAGLLDRGHQVQPAQSSVIVHLELEGTRPSVLAERAGITKQAMGKIVDELEGIGYVEKVADSGDGRAKLIRFTDKGLRLLADSRAIVDDIWNDYTELIGEERLQRLRDDLNTLRRKAVAR